MRRSPLDKKVERPRTFAGELARRTGLRMVRFAVTDREFGPISRAKHRFGTVAVARLLARLCREVLGLCRAAGHK